MRHEAPGGQWDSLCIDMRELVLSKLSRADLARPAGTCREFREAFRSRAAQEQAALIALAEEKYGRGQVKGIVRAIQRAMCGLEPCPGIPDTCRGTPDIVVFDQAGEPRLVARTVANRMWEEGTRMARISCGLFTVKADLQLHWDGPGSYADRSALVWVDVSRHLSGDMQVIARLWEATPASIGVVLAICTANPDTVLPCMQSPVILDLELGGVYETEEAGTRARHDLAAPLRLLTQRCTFSPNHRKLKPLKRKQRARAGSVLQWLKCRWRK
jgi:hypothetical protein